MRCHGHPPIQAHALVRFYPYSGAGAPGRLLRQESGIRESGIALLPNLAVERTSALVPHVLSVRAARGDLQLRCAPHRRFRNETAPMACRISARRATVAQRCVPAPAALARRPVARRSRVPKNHHLGSLRTPQAGDPSCHHRTIDSAAQQPHAGGTGARLTPGTSAGDNRRRGRSLGANTSPRASARSTQLRRMDHCATRAHCANPAAGGVLHSAALRAAGTRNETAPRRLVPARRATVAQSLRTIHSGPGGSAARAIPKNHHLGADAPNAPATQDREPS